jgi:nitrogen-specific signal transduction histidine kinase
MEFFAISGLLNGIAATGLALLIYNRSPQDPRYWTYAFFWSTIAIWSFGYFFWLSSNSPGSALFFSRLLMAGATFIPVAFFHHIVSLLGTRHRFQRFLKVQYYVGTIFSLLVWTPYYIQGVAPVAGFPYWPIPGAVFHVSLIWWGLVILYAHWQLVQAYRHEKGVHRKQYRYLLIASAIGFLGGSTNFPLWYGIEVPPYGNIFVTLYVAIVGYTFLRYHLMGFSVFVEKGLSYFSLLLLISQPFYPVLLIAQKSVFGSISLRYSVVQLAVHVLTVAGAYQMKMGTRGAVARTILKGREYRLKTLNQLTSKVSQVQGVSEVGQAILEALQHGISVSKSAIFVFNRGENIYRVVSMSGFSPEHPIYRDGIKLSDDLPQLLSYTQSKVSLNELRVAPFDPWEDRVATTMENLGFKVCYPVFSNYQLVGILALGPVASELRRVLGGALVRNTLIQESILALENAILRKELLRSQNSLQQIDRLRSVGAMTQGLTQELHNPVMSIKAFVQLSQLRRHDKKFMDNLHRVVGDDLAKIEQLTQEIREYVKPLSETEFDQVNIDETIKACLLFFSNNPIYKDIQFDTQYFSSLPSLPIDRQGFMQVMFNALLFLLKDTDRSGQVLQIRAEAARRASGQCWVILYFSWITQENSRYVKFLTLGKEELEPPLFASLDGCEKRGLFLASQIVQRYSGSLEVQTNTQEQIFGIRIQIPVHSLNISQKMISKAPVSSIQVQEF